MEINITVSVAVYCKTCGAPLDGGTCNRNGLEVVTVIPCRRCVIEEAAKELAKNGLESLIRN